MRSGLAIGMIWVLSSCVAVGQDNKADEEIQKANAKFERAKATAQDEIKKAFETALDRLAQQKGGIDQRLKLIDAVKAEKERFEKSGSIPWSEPMRSYSAIYVKALQTLDGELQKSYRSVLDNLLKAKQQEHAEKLLADLKAVRGVHVVAK